MILAIVVKGVLRGALFFLGGESMTTVYCSKHNCLDCKKDGTCRLSELHIDQYRGMYPKSKGMPGVCLGTPTIRLCGTERKVTVEL